jgi:hypothetical protein
MVFRTLGDVGRLGEPGQGLGDLDSIDPVHRIRRQEVVADRPSAEGGDRGPLALAGGGRQLGDLGQIGADHDGVQRHAVHGQPPGGIGGRLDPAPSVQRRNVPVLTQQAATSSSAVAPVRARTAREPKSKRKHGPPVGTTFYFTLHRSRWRGCCFVRQTAARSAARSRVPARESKAQCDPPKTAPPRRAQRPRRRAAGFAHQEAHRRPGPARLCWGRRRRLDPVDVRIAPGLSRWRRAGRWCRRVPLAERAREVQASGR